LALERTGAVIHLRLQPAALLRLGFSMVKERIESPPMTLSLSTSTASVALVVSTVASTDLNPTGTELCIGAALRALIIAQYMVGTLRTQGMRVYWAIVGYDNISASAEQVMSSLRQAGFEPSTVQIHKETDMKYCIDVQSDMTKHIKPEDAMLQYNLTKAVEIFAQHEGALLARKARIIAIVPNTRYACICRASTCVMQRRSGSSMFECFSVGAVRFESDVQPTFTGAVLEKLREHMIYMMSTEIDEYHTDHIEADYPTHDDAGEYARTLRATTLAALCGFFLKAKRNKHVQIVNDVAKLLLERSQPIIYLMYTCLKVRAILDAYDNNLLKSKTSMNVPDMLAYADALAIFPESGNVMRSLVSYVRDMDEAYRRCEPCVLIASAVTAARQITRLCEVLRVKDQPPSIAVPRAYLFLTCYTILSNAITRLGLQLPHRM
jgi:hypothetical protein